MNMENHARELVEPVAAERDNGVGGTGLGIPVASRQARQGLPGLGYVARHERDLLELSRYALH